MNISNKLSKASEYSFELATRTNSYIPMAHLKYLNMFWILNCFAMVLRHLREVFQISSTCWIALISIMCLSTPIKTCFIRLILFQIHVCTFWGFRPNWNLDRRLRRWPTQLSGWCRGWKGIRYIREGDLPVYVVQVQFFLLA